MGISEEDDGKGVSVSVRIPNRALVMLIAGITSGVIGVGAALYQTAEGAKTEHTEQLAYSAIDIAKDAMARTTALAATIERMQVDLLQQTNDRYTKSEADKIHRDFHREHEIFKQTDDSHDRLILRLDGEIDRLESKAGESN